MTAKRFVALDRDGTVIALHDYLSDPDRVELLPGAARALLSLRQLGLGLVLITNQSGVGRGYFSVDRLSEIHQRLTDLLRDQGIELDGIYFCPHTPEDGCDCRKPKLGLMRQASLDLGFVGSESFVVGDNECDIELGRNLGATTFLVATGYGAKTARDGKIQPNYFAADLGEVAEIIQRLIAAPEGVRER